MRIKTIILFFICFLSHGVIGQTTPVSVTKPLSVVSGITYQGSVDIVNNSSNDLFIRILDQTGQVLPNSELIIGSASSGNFNFTFMPTVSGNYTIWIGYDVVGNNTFSIDNFQLNQIELVEEQVCVSESKYRYGMNGMERDDEVKGYGNSYTTEFRQYDPRLGRWLSLDPLAPKFPWQSPYAAFDNNPIRISDPNGLAGKESNLPNPKRQKRQANRAKRKLERINNKFNKKFEKYNKDLPESDKLNRQEYLDMMVEKSGLGGGNKEPKWLTKYLERNGVKSITAWEEESVSPVSVFGGTSINTSGTSSGTNDAKVDFSSGEVYIEINSSTNGGRGGTWNGNVNVQITDETGSVIVNTNIPTTVNSPSGTPNESVSIPYSNPSGGDVTITVTGGNFITGYTVEFRPDNVSNSKPKMTTKKNPLYNKKVKGKKLFNN